MFPKHVDEQRISVNDLGLIVTICKAIVFHIECIENEDGPEAVKAHIEAIEIADKRAPKGFEGSRPIKESIRLGSGDFASIRDKCVKMGLV